MAIWRFEKHTPIVGNKTYVAESADIIGNVTLGKNCYIGPGARIRGDYGKITIGSGTSIQENVVIHARPDEITKIGISVTAGHSCVIHNCTIGDYVVIGMGSVVSDYAILEEWAVLGEKSLAKRGQKIAEKQIAVGAPAKVIGNLKSLPKLQEEYMNFKEKYVEMAHRHLKKGALEKIN